MQNSLNAGLGEGEDSCSAVSWPAILGGTFAALALTLVLVGFGSGMGLAMAAPWSHDGMTAKHVTYAAAAWIIFVQWASSGLGGYLTGRLRTKWAGVHTHEVFFRDTAHGFLTWAVATVVGAVLLSMAASSMHNMHQEGPAQGGPMTYEVDSMLRTDHAGPAIDPETKMEVTQILLKGVKDGSLSAEDSAYLSQMIAGHTGMTQPEAEKKVQDFVSQAHEKAKAARKVAETVSIFTLLSMFIGAFIACVAAAIGGQERDAPHPPVAL